MHLSSILWGLLCGATFWATGLVVSTKIYDDGHSTGNSVLIGMIVGVVAAAVVFLVIEYVSERQFQREMQRENEVWATQMQARMRTAAKRSTE